MCRSVVQCDPARGLAAFVPLLVDTLAARMRERPAAGDSQDTADTKLDEELQFNLQLLGEVLSCTNIGVFRSRGEHILPWVDRSAQALLYVPITINTYSSIRPLLRPYFLILTSSASTNRRMRV